MQQLSTPVTRKQSVAAATIMAGMAQSADQDSWFEQLLEEVRKRVIGQLQPAQIEDPTDADARMVRETIVQPLVDNYYAMARQQGMAPLQSADITTNKLMDEVFGVGPLGPYLEDPEIEEIICNGPDDVWIIHAQRGKEKTSAKFRTDKELINFVNFRVEGSRHLDAANPKIDARIKKYGARLHAVMNPLTVNVPIALTIRRHRLVASTLDDLVRLNTISPQAGEFLHMAVKARLNIVVAGGTASGKTNFLNAMGNAADDRDRFILIEDTPELRINKPDIVQMVTREKMEEARAFTIADLVIEALRMRPDRIITGEARGPEMVDVLMAANTGHDGQMLTIHANSTRDVIQRMETMYLMRGADVPLIAIRRQIADAFQLVVFLKRVLIGNRPKRVVTQIAEIQPSQFMEGDKVVVQNIFEDAGQGAGLAYTGTFPERLAHRMNDNGVPISHHFFRQTGR